MKKSIKFGIAACMAVALSAAGFNFSKSNSNGVSLGDLMMTSEANAECAPSEYYSASGRCLQTIQMCVGAVGYRDCDPYKSSF